MAKKMLYYRIVQCIRIKKFTTWILSCIRIKKSKKKNHTNALQIETQKLHDLFIGTYI